MHRSIYTCLTAGGYYTRTTSLCIQKLHQKLSLHSAVGRALCKPASKHLTPVLNPNEIIIKSPIGDTDILLEQLKKASSVTRIIELLSLHHSVMNNKHIVVCYESLYFLMKKEKEVPDLSSSSVFQSLCNRTISRSRFFDVQDVVTVFRTLSLLEIGSESFVMQAILQMLRHQINDLTLRQLIFVNFLMSKQKPTPLVDALRMAIPLVLQVQVDQQLDSDNVNEMVECLNLSCRTKLKISTIEKIIAGLLKRVPVLSPEQALTVCMSLLRLEAPAENYVNLINAAAELISNNVETLDSKSLVTLISMIRRRNLYHRSLFLAVTEKAISEKWNLEECYFLIRHFLYFEFVSNELLELFSKRILANQEIIKNDRIFSVLSIAEAFGLTAYHPSQADDVWNVLSSSEEKIMNLKMKSPGLFVKFLSFLAILEHFPSNLLSEVLNERFLFETLSHSNKIGRTAELERDLSCLHWALDLYHPEYNQQHISSNVLSFIHSSKQSYNEDYEFPLKKALEQGIGGTEFVCTGVYSKQNHFIDHLVVVRKDNFAVSLNSVKENTHHKEALDQIAFIEDSCFPIDTAIIAIIVAYEDSFCRDLQIYKSWLKLKIKSLMKHSYCPVVIPYNTLSELSEAGKIEYLMREINEAQKEHFSQQSLSPG